ncbi:uncharacterized protein [Diadema antillarum]|uniref:uncharacterized protein n=1 Tax=Diadema antillarum TaxID=105358 RepID=UPI003A8ABCD8
MGSRPTRVRSVDIQPEGINGKLSMVSVDELQTENSQLKKRISDLEQLNADKLIEENERLKKQNEDLRNELVRVKQASEMISSHAIAVPVKKSSDLSIRDGNLDTLSDNTNLTPSPTIERRIHSDRSSSPGYSSCKTSPNVNDGRKRKIDPSSILQRMSDIDAYGQGLPLADSGLMVKNVRRTRSRKRKTTTTASNGSPTNSEGTTSPAEVSANVEKGERDVPKSSEDAQNDSGVHTHDVDSHQTDVNLSPETNDILMT